MHIYGFGAILAATPVCAQIYGPSSRIISIYVNTDLGRRRNIRTGYSVAREESVFILFLLAPQLILSPVRFSIWVTQVLLG